MSVIVPALLCHTAEDLSAKIFLASSFTGVTKLHIDIADGVFVPNQTISAGHLPVMPLQYIFQAHLMVHNPEDYVTDIQRVGFESAVIHVESFKTLTNAHEMIATLKDLNIETVIAFNPGTSVESLASFLPMIQAVLVMGVEPGFYASTYIPETEQRVRALRLLGFYGKIYVDGGITKENLPKLLAAGADQFIVGSSIFAAPDPTTAFMELSRLVD